MKTLAFPLFLSALALAGCNNQREKESAEQDPPNFILFITDDISYNDLGCYGNTFAKTPNIDRMAGEGLRFTNAYLTASSCSPSRSSIITARYPHNTGAPELHTKLPANQVFFPDLMQEAGYYTVLSGKNHMGKQVKSAFDTLDWGGGPGGEQFWIDHLRDRPKNQPFFFWLASFDAHRKWQTDSTAPLFNPGEVWVPPMLFDGPKTREDLTGYYHEVSRTDYYLGRIMDELERQNIGQNTYVIYMSDNGRPFPRAKTRCYDSGMKTPFIIWNPGAVAAGTTASLVSAIDIAPTVLELAGLKSHPRFQGVSFAPILENPEATTRDYVFAEHNWHVYRNHERMLRMGDFMYIRNSYNEKRNLCRESAPFFPAGVELWEAYEQGRTNPRQEDIFTVPRPEEELYHVTEDPFQFHNLAGDPRYSKTLEECREILDRWIEQTGDNIPENPTPDREDIYMNENPEFERGEMPGEKTGADTITRKGPVRSI